jgi:Calcineurin-like phosphoesterase
MNKMRTAALLFAGCACTILSTVGTAHATWHVDTSEAWTQELWFVSDVLTTKGGGSLSCADAQPNAQKVADIVKNNKTVNPIVLTTETNNCRDYRTQDGDKNINKPYDDFVSNFWNRTEIPHGMPPESWSWWAVPGNHDYLSRSGSFDKVAESFHSFFGIPADGYTYRGEWALPWVVIMLDSELTDATAHTMQEQVNDFNAALSWARSAGFSCQLVVSHNPAWSNAKSHANKRLDSRLTQAMVNHGVDLLLSGHEHVYERLAPQASTGNVVQVVAGTGGSSYSTQGWNSQFQVGTGGTPQIQQRYGAVRVLLNSNQTYRVDFYGVVEGNPYGQVVDSYQGSCQP